MTNEQNEFANTNVGQLGWVAQYNKLIDSYAAAGESIPNAARDMASVGDFAGAVELLRTNTAR